MLSETSGQFLCLHEIVAAARENLSEEIWDYLVGGTETETTLKRNRHALDSIGFKPRVLRDVSKIDVSGTLMGRKTRLPVALAPIGGLESFEAGGGATVAKAAAEYDVFTILSSVCKPGLEEVAAAANGPKIYQLYVRGDADWVDDHVRRAIDNGYHAFCLTVDTAIYSRRERDITKRFLKPWRQRVSGLEFQAGLNWDDVRRIKDKFPIPLILKGIGTGEDAATACELGVDVVYVSNHGGRQLDHGRGSMQVLPEVVDAVKGRAEIIVDGGICRGSDVVKAIASGANAVGIGRLVGYGMGADGQAGVIRVLEILEAEIISCLGLLGAPSFGNVDGSFICPTHPVEAPHALSAFPLLDLVPTNSARG